MFVPTEPDQHRAVATWEQPFDMLRACHERVLRILSLLAKLQAHVAVHGVDAQASQAAMDVMRYFDQAAPLHHQDEELHIFPAANQCGDPDAIAAVIRLGVEHQTMEADWRHLRTELQALLAEKPCDPLPPAWQTDQLVQAFCARYAEHIRIEEQMVYPCVEAVLAPHDAETMGREMAARRGAGLQPRAF
jgi:hemerythrin-like domain-containing protein